MSEALASLVLSIELSQELASKVIESMQVELSQEMARTEVSIDYRDNTLILTISTKDLSSMRAALNSYLRWLNLCINTLKFAQI